MTRPTVNMLLCRPGTTLLSKHGMKLVYVEHQPGEPFPHRVQYPNGAHGTRTDEGWVFRNKPLPGDHDIVEILVAE